jgi:hypothetical protein
MKYDTDYMIKSLAKYKILPDLIATRNTSISIKLPDAGKTEDAEILKLIRDLNTGSFKPQRMISYNILDRYASGNEIEINFVTEYVTQKPKFVFHWSKSENIEKILKEGLKPSSSNWEIGTGLGRSSGRTTYVATFFVEKYNSLCKVKGFENYKNPKYKCLQIDASNLKLWRDPHNMKTSSGADPMSYLTYEYVSSNKIKIQS